MTTSAPKQGAHDAAEIRDPYKESMTIPTQKMASALQDLLGQRVVAYSTGVRSPKAVGRWSRGEGPHPGTERKLRALYRAALMIEEAYGPETARAWFDGANPELDNTAPSTALREGREVDVFHAADNFTK